MSEQGGVRGVGVPTITAAEVSDDSFILDVREPDEWQAGHIPGAMHVPLASLPDRVADVPSDTPVVVTCRVGGRSARAVAFLNSSGLTAINLEGGMQAWAAAGREMRTDNGSAPSVI